VAEELRVEAGGDDAMPVRPPVVVVKLGADFVAEMLGVLEDAARHVVGIVGGLLPRSTSAPVTFQ